MTECVALMVLNHCGIDVNGYSFARIATWAQDRAVEKCNLDAILFGEPLLP